MLVCLVLAPNQFCHGATTLRFSRRLRVADRVQVSVNGAECVHYLVTEQKSVHYTI